jgi:hypothetical protein
MNTAALKLVKDSETVSDNAWSKCVHVQGDKEGPNLGTDRSANPWRRRAIAKAQQRPISRNYHNRKAGAKGTTPCVTEQRAINIPPSILRDDVGWTLKPMECRLLQTPGRCHTHSQETTRKQQLLPLG